MVFDNHTRERSGISLPDGICLQVTAQMNQTAVDESVKELLDDLRERKSWLDMMIQGLEAAVESPEHQLIASVEQAFEGERRKSARSDLQIERRAALATLAQDVQSSPRARRRRSLPHLHQAVST